MNNRLSTRAMNYEYNNYGECSNKHVHMHEMVIHKMSNSCSLLAINKQYEFYLNVLALYAYNLCFLTISKSDLVLLAKVLVASNSADVSWSRLSTPSNLHTYKYIHHTHINYFYPSSNFSMAFMLGAAILCSVD